MEYRIYKPGDRVRRKHDDQLMEVIKYAITPDVLGVE